MGIRETQLKALKMARMAADLCTVEGCRVREVGEGAMEVICGSCGLVRVLRGWSDSVRPVVELSINDDLVEVAGFRAPGLRDTVRG